MMKIYIVFMNIVAMIFDEIYGFWSIFSRILFTIKNVLLSYLAQKQYIKVILKKW